MKIVFQCLVAQLSLLRPLVKDIAIGDTGLALNQFSVMRKLLADPKLMYLGPFNVKEILWWLLLLREAFDFACGFRRSA